jgi:hypothetical protein
MRASFSLVSPSDPVTTATSLLDVDADPVELVRSRYNVDDA